MTSLAAENQPARPQRGLAYAQHRHWGRWAINLILVALAIRVLYSVQANPRFGWNVFSHYFLSAAILKGLRETVVITVVSMGIGIVLGTVLAAARMSRIPPLSSAAWLYVWFFRGTPVLIQIIFWYNISALYPRLHIQLPLGPTLYDGSLNHLIAPATAAILALGLNEAAYMAEVVRGGLLSVDRGQAEAASSLGLTAAKRFRRIILPQALPVIMPPTGNEVIKVLQGSALLSVVALPELLFTATQIYSANYQTIPLLMVVSTWYLVVTICLWSVQALIERRLNHSKRSKASVPLADILGRWLPRR